MRALHALALCIALLALAVAAQRPKLKYGLTLAQCGVSASIAVLQRQTLLWYANFTNAHGGVNISGVIHDIEFVIYNDAFDNQLMGILYERLVTEDKVDLLMGPLGAGPAGFAVAQKYKKVVMNSGDFTYYSAFSAPNGTFGGWLFSAVPNALFLADQCFAQLRAGGATTVSSAWPENVRSNSFDVINILAAGKSGIGLAGDAPLILDDLSNLDDVISKVKAQKADVFSGTLLSPDASHTVVDRMIRAGYEPKAFMVWIGPNYRSFRDAAPWQAAGMLFPGAWDPSLNYADKLFGSSQGFFDEFFAGVGREPDVTDVVAVFAAESLRLAVEIAGTTDSDAIRAALLSMNEQTFFGVANFTADALQQTNAGYYCFQVADNGKDIFPISANAPQPKTLKYPVKLDYPSGYVTSKSQRSKWLGVGLGVGLGVLVLVALGFAAYFIVVKYQIVFIPKSEEKGEW